MSTLKKNLPIKRAFTMVEILIVIGIIVLLAGLTVTVGTGMLQKSKINETEQMLRILDQAVTEWEVSSDLKISWGEDNVPNNARYDIQYDDTPDDQLTALLERVRRAGGIKEIISQIDAEYLRQFEDINDNNKLKFHVFDPWDTRVYMIHPGRVADHDNPYFDPGNGDPLPPFDQYVVDNDLTIRVRDGHPALGGEAYGWENRYGICVNRRICFVSAGPDGKFGDLSYAEGTPEHDQTMDNIYSYPVEDPLP